MHYIRDLTHKVKRSLLRRISAVLISNCRHSKPSEMRMLSCQMPRKNVSTISMVMKNQSEAVGVIIIIMDSTSMMIHPMVSRLIWQLRRFSTCSLEAECLGAAFMCEEEDDGRDKLEGIMMTIMGDIIMLVIIMIAHQISRQYSSLCPFCCWS